MFLRKIVLISLLAAAFSLFAGSGQKTMAEPVMEAEPVFVYDEEDFEEENEKYIEELLEEEVSEEPAQERQSELTLEINGKKEPIKVNIEQNLKIENYNKANTAREYVLGPNDILNISVTNVPELSKGSIRVDHEGNISLAYIGQLKVVGLTLEQLKQVLTYHYNEYVIEPEVLINIEQAKPFIVYVSGAVRNPGSYELNTVPNQSPFISKPEAFIERKTPLLSNIIVAAGGLSYDADFEHVKVTNELDGSVIEVNLLTVINESDYASDLFLMAGDKIVVPRHPSPAAIEDEKYRLLVKSTLFQRDFPVRVIGYVRSPGLIRLSSDQEATLNSAIARAGGYPTDYGDFPDKVHISRLDNNHKLVTMKVNPMREDIAIMPNDVIYVPAKDVPLIAKMFDLVGRLINPFGAFSNTYQSWENMLD